MSFTGRPRVPPTPTLPKGEQVASYGTYLDAQRAVDHLADKQFPVQLVTIVGTDLRMVERVTGRLSYPRVAAAGLASGAWFGLFVGLLLTLFSTGSQSFSLLAAILIGAAFGMLFSVITYSFTGGKRDFTSASQIVAGSYSVLCAVEQAHKARALLREIGGTVSGWPGAVPTPVLNPTTPSDPTATYPVRPPTPPTDSPTVPPTVPPDSTPGPVSPSAPPVHPAGSWPERTEPPTQPPAPPQS